LGSHERCERGLQEHVGVLGQAFIENNLRVVFSVCGKGKFIGNYRGPRADYESIGRAWPLPYGKDVIGLCVSNHSLLSVDAHPTAMECGYAARCSRSDN
jgi:hypothetical protein